MFGIDGTSLVPENLKIRVPGPGENADIIYASYILILKSYDIWFTSGFRVQN